MADFRTAHAIALSFKSQADAMEAAGMPIEDIANALLSLAIARYERLGMSLDAIDSKIAHALARLKAEKPT